MGLIDEWAERQIISAQEKGEFEDLSGHGQPLILDDDTFVPAELRAGYRLLKNAGYLPLNCRIGRKHSPSLICCHISTNSMMIMRICITEWLY